MDQIKLNKLSKKELIRLLVEADELIRKGLPKCSNPECKKHFVRSANNQKYCSKTCLRAAWQPDYNKNYYQANREKYLEKSKERYTRIRTTDDYKKRVNKKTIEWRKQNPEWTKKAKSKYYQKHKNRILKKQQKDREAMTDEYVKSTIKKLCKRSDIEPSKRQIEQKKLALKIKRLSNEITREVNTSGNHGRPNNVLP